MAASLWNGRTEKSVNFLFEASVGGGIPIIRPLIRPLHPMRFMKLPVS